MSRAQLQQDIANALALAGQDWVQGSAALNAAFANMLTSLDNMGNQVLAMQAQNTATATATAQMAKISKLLADPGPFDESMSKFEEWWAKVKAWQAENHLAMPANTDKPVHAVLSRLEGPKASVTLAPLFAPILPLSLFAIPGDRTPNLTTITVTTKLLHSLS